MFEGLIREVVDLHEDLLRNIKGIRQSQSLFDDLSSNAADQAAAIAAEAADRIPSDAPLLTRPFDYGTEISYPFVPEHWQSTRFSNGLHYGVWYGAKELETTVYETVHHWRRFLLDSFPAENRTIISERRVFLARADGIFVDLVGKELAWPDLVNRNDYRFTHALGQYLQERKQNGLLVRSARCDRVNAAVFQPEVLSNVRDHCYLTYTTNPTIDEVLVERAPGVQWMRIRPSSLA